MFITGVNDTGDKLFTDVKLKKFTGGQLRKSVDCLAACGGLTAFLRRTSVFILELKFTYKRRSGGIGILDVGSGTRHVQTNYRIKLFYKKLFYF
jgi:hypothetical protein